MASFLPDSSCIIAAVTEWHSERDVVRRQVDERLASGHRLILAGPALVESYSVLSRLPQPRRLSPRLAWQLIQSNFVDRAEDVVGIDGTMYRRLLENAASRGTAGGGVYDAVIVACAIAANVETILTFNERHFLPIVPATIKVVVPM